jgi:MFS family permease
MAYLSLLALGALDAAGYSVIAPVVPAIADETGAGPGVMGALVATFAVGMAVGFVLGGQGVQRRHASFVLGASIVLMAVGSLGFVLGEGHLAAYFAARLVMGIGSGGLWMGVTFATLERFRGQEYERLTGVLAAYSIGGIAGAGLGAAGGIQGPFLLYCALTLAATGAVRLLGEPRESFGQSATWLGRPPGEQSPNGSASARSGSCRSPPRCSCSRPSRGLGAEHGPLGLIAIA